MCKTLKVLMFFFIFNKIGFSIAQSPNYLLKVLKEKNVLTENEIDSIIIENHRQQALNNKTISSTFELRPRFEYRHGYNQLANDTTYDAAFLSHRARIATNFKIDDKIEMQFTFQDIRIYGQQDPKGTSVSTLQVFEAWAEPLLTKHFSVRLGRQKLSYDNQRLFAENNWRQTGVSHDAIVLKFSKKIITSELAIAYNQNKEQYSGTLYNPKEFNNFKTLIIHYLYYKKKYLGFTLLNSCDGQQDLHFSEKQFFRLTNGGRIELWQNNWYFTVNAYWQWGTDNQKNKIEAFYFNPEIEYNYRLKKIVARAGAEYFSGNNSNAKGKTNRSFIPLMGSAHNFNGSLDLITRFPDDVGGAGLFNPYLVLKKLLFEKLEILSSKHLFYLNHNYYYNNKKINPYLGFEHDLLLVYKPNKFTKAELGYSYAFITKSFEIVKKAKINSHYYSPTWFYCSISFKPEIFYYNFK